MPKLSKVVHDVYRSLSEKKCPMFVLCVSAVPGSFDVNVTPDKRQVFLHSEKQMVQRVQETLTAMLEPHRYTYQVKRLTDFLGASASDSSSSSQITSSQESWLGSSSQESLS